MTTQKEIARKINERMATLAAVCLTMSQIPADRECEASQSQPQKIKAVGGMWIHGRMGILMEAIIRSPFLGRYFVAGARPRDMCDWEDLEVEPGEELLPPIKIIEQWDAGEISTKTAKRRWMALKDVVQPEFRQWGKMMLCGNLTRKLQLGVKLPREDSTYPPHIAKLRSLGFYHLWATQPFGSIPSGRIYTITPDGLVADLQADEVRQGDIYTMHLLDGEIGHYQAGHSIPLSEIIRRYD